MNRVLTIVILALLSSWNALAQREHYTGDPSFAEQAGLTNQGQERLRVYLNTHMTADAGWGIPKAGSKDQFRFKAKQLRIEAKGVINDLLSFRWLQRLNSSNDATHAIDNLPMSIDVAGLGVTLSDKVSLFLGKQCAAFGGVEFDFNPIEVYEFADMIEYTPCFMTGASFTYDVTPVHRIHLQVLNARNSSLSRTYPEVASALLEDTYFPLLYSFYWSGQATSFWKTMWSYSYATQTKRHGMHYIALGNEFKFGQFGAYLDVMYSREGLNSKPLIPVVEHAEYYSYTLKLNYRLSPKWNIFAKGMYETAEAGDPDKWWDSKRMRTAYGYVGGVEYYPMEDNLRFFFTYVGRSYRFDVPHTSDYSTNRLSLGFIYQLPLF